MLWALSLLPPVPRRRLPAWTGCCGAASGRLALEGPVGRHRQVHAQVARQTEMRGRAGSKKRGGEKLFLCACAKSHWWGATNRTGTYIVHDRHQSGAPCIVHDRHQGGGGARCGTRLRAKFVRCGCGSRAQVGHYLGPSPGIPVSGWGSSRNSSAGCTRKQQSATQKRQTTPWLSHSVGSEQSSDQPHRMQAHRCNAKPLPVWPINAPNSRRSHLEKAAFGLKQAAHVLGRRVAMPQATVVGRHRHMRGTKTSEREDREREREREEREKGFLDARNAKRLSG